MSTTTTTTVTGDGDGGEGEVVQLHGEVKLAFEDCALIEDARRRMNDERQQLGSERERYLAARAPLLAEVETLARAYEAREVELYRSLAQASDAYEQLIGAFASKYIHRPGRYSFRPDLGAFVLTEETGDGEVRRAETRE